MDNIYTFRDFTLLTDCRTLSKFFMNKVFYDTAHLLISFLLEYRQMLEELYFIQALLSIYFIKHFIIGILGECCQIAIAGAFDVVVLSLCF